MQRKLAATGEVFSVRCSVFGCSPCLAFASVTAQRISRLVGGRSVNWFAIINQKILNITSPAFWFIGHVPRLCHSRGSPWTVRPTQCNFFGNGRARRLAKPSENSLFTRMTQPWAMFFRTPNTEHRTLAFIPAMAGPRARMKYGLPPPGADLQKSVHAPCRRVGAMPSGGRQSGAGRPAGPAGETAPFPLP